MFFNNLRSENYYFDLKAEWDEKDDLYAFTEIDRLNFDDKGPYKYTATIEVNPEIQDIDFKGIKLKKSLYTLTENQIEDQLKMIQKNFGTLEPLLEDRPLQESDAATIDYEVFQNGAPFAEIPKATDYFIKCHPEPYTFVYSVGSSEDHNYWGPPELQTDERSARDVVVCTPSNPASDVCGNTAASLALMYLNYYDIPGGIEQASAEAAADGTTSHRRKPRRLGR